MQNEVRLRPVASAEPAVRLVEVSRTYLQGHLETAAVAAVTLTIDHREVVAITGPSGSGKTTLLNIIGGIDRPSTGAVQVLGHDLDRLSHRSLTEFRARHVGFVFQEAYLLPSLSALDNVIAARLPWEKRRVLAERAAALLSAVGLGRRLAATPAQLSTGEKQRVALARALIGEPSILLADEPTGALDMRTTEELLNLLDHLYRERHFTMVIATHDPVVAAAADRVLRLVGGRLADALPGRSAPVLPTELRDD